MKNILSTILLAAIFLASCSHSDYEKEIAVKSFPIEETLPGTRFDLADAEYLSNLAYFAGDFLVFSAIRGNYFLQVYDRELNLVGKILNRGEGPEELPDARWCGQWSGAETNPDIFVFCEAKKRLAHLNINPFTGLTTVCDIPVSEDLDPTMIFQTSDTTLMGISLSISNGSTLFCYNPETKSVRRAQSPFEFAGGHVAFYTSQQMMDFDARRKELCCSYLSFPSIVIYDYQFNVLRKIHIGEPVNTAELGYESKHPGLKNVKYFKDKLLVMLIDDETEESKLLIFETDGTPLASYSIGYAIGFIIDEEGNRILSVKYDTEKDIIYLDSHEIPSILK